MSKLPDDPIGIYHRIFDFSGVQIPFSSFLLALIKLYRVYFFQLGPLGLNKVISFEVRHPDAPIDDSRPVVGSFNMADVHRLSAHVIKLRDIPDGVLVLSGLSRVWKNRFYDLEEPHLDVRPTLPRLPFYCTPPATIDVVILNPSPEVLATGTTSSKILAKVKASQKRKASVSGAASSYVAKRTRFASAQSSSSTTRPSLFAGDDDESNDDNACVEIPLVTPLRSTEVIPSLGNQGGSFVAPTAEGSNIRGKGIMVDDAVVPSSGVSRQRPSFGPAPSFRDVFGDAIHMNFFSFFAGHYYATYPEDGVAGNYEFTWEEWDAPYRPTFRVLTKEVFKDPAICNTIVDQFSTPGEMVRVKDSRLKGYEEKVAGLTGLELQVSTLKKQERKKKIKSLSKSLDNFHSEVACLSAALNQATILETERDEEILRPKATPLKLEPEKLVHPANVPIPRDTRVSPPVTKKSTVTLVPKSLELSANVAHVSSVVASKQNEEQVNAVVDGSDLEMVDDAASSKSGGVFVQGVSHVLDDVIEATAVESEHISFVPTDVVVAFSVGGRGRARGILENTCCFELREN
nr:transposase (putative), gypsy type [Tanacetum cinerariifolium]